MKIGQQKTIGGVPHQCVAIRNGEPIFREVAQANGTKFVLGEPCRIVNIYGKRVFAGEITSIKPLRAKITEDDKIWNGCEVIARQIRKAKG